MNRKMLARLALRLHESGQTYEEVAVALADHYEGTLAFPSRGWVARLIRLARAERANRDAHEVTGATPRARNGASLSHVSGNESSADTDDDDTARYLDIADRAGGARDGYRVRSVTYRGGYLTRDIPSYDGAWELTGDCMVINDVHIPATNWTFAARVLEIAERHLPRPRRLIIAGDLINGDALSRWDDLVLCTPLADELSHARAFLNWLAGTFDEIYMTRGNHENRLLFSLRGQLAAEQFRQLFTDDRRLRFSLYSWLRVTTGGQTWHITHQRNYSRNALTVARKLAAKHAMHIISAHQHHSAVGRDTSNQYTVIDSGGLHDSKLMAYVGLEDNTSPVMNNGFVLLRDGIGTLFTPATYMMTDWDMWTRDNAKAQAA